jgi:hypothetical protein
MSINQDELPLPWNFALLAVVPGFMAMLGLIRFDYSGWMLVGLILLTSFMVCAILWNNRKIPAWSLMAAGILASFGLMIASGVIGGLTSILVGKSANLLVVLLLLIFLVTLLGIFLRRQRVSLFILLLFIVIVVLQLTIRLKYFVLFGVSWSVAGEWLSISLYAIVITLLLPVALGLPLVRHYGSLALLFTIGMIYMGFQILIDVNHKVSDQIGGTAGFYAYKALIPMIFTIFAPLWFLRASSPRRRMGGVLALVGLAVILNLVIVGLSYHGDLPQIIWISFIPYTISVLITLALANLLYSQRGNHRKQTGIKTPHGENAPPSTAVVE